MSKPNKTPSDSESELRELARRHLRLAWVALSVFVTLGFVLEILHALKLPLYLNVGNETRRLMWTLAHAHGVGLSLLNMGFGVTLERLWSTPPRGILFASKCITIATVFLPLGFFLGGIVTYGGDPGLGALLVPVAAVVLLAGVFVVAREAMR
jgi:hypothetical protein